MLVGEPVGAGLLAARRDPPEQRPVGDAGELSQVSRAATGQVEVAGAAADLDLAPAGLRRAPG